MKLTNLKEMGHIFSCSRIGSRCVSVAIMASYNNYQPFCYLKSNNNVNMYHLLGWLMYKTIMGNN